MARDADAKYWNYCDYLDDPVSGSGSRSGSDGCARTYPGSTGRCTGKTPSSRTWRSPVSLVERGRDELSEFRTPRHHRDASELARKRVRSGP